MSSAPKKLFLASGNAHKISELKNLIEPLGMEVLSTQDWDKKAEVDEDQPTLKGNALKKARFWNSETGIPAIADDTGLEVDALDGNPGVRSARYAGENATDTDNLEKLLDEMSGKKDRSARFKTVIAYVDGRDELTFQGICEGSIIYEPKGEAGFGYDPVFVPEGYEKTFAELSRNEKNKISHRGRALRNFLDFMRNR